MTDSAKLDLSAAKEAVDKMQAEKDPQSLADVYVEKPKLNPEAIGSSLLDRMPAPTGWRILILPYQGKAKTAGGIFIPNEVQEKKPSLYTSRLCPQGWPVGLPRQRKVPFWPMVQREAVGNVCSLRRVSFSNRRWGGQDFER